jgi:nucleoside-diphosphate-sugar epimerase
MRILIAGSNGMIGSTVTRRLSEKGHEPEVEFQGA